MSEGLICLCGHDDYGHGRLIEFGALIDWACAQCDCPAFRPAHDPPSFVLVEPEPDHERLDPPVKPQERNTA